MKSKFRFFRFGLKTFLAFVLVCGVCAGWLAHNQREHKIERAAIAAIQSTTNSYTYDFYENGPRTKVLPAVFAVR